MNNNEQEFMQWVLALGQVVLGVERERERKESPSLHFEVATLLIEKGIPLE